MRRYSGVVKVRPGKLEEYKRLHAAAWPHVLEVLKKHHIRNFSIFYKDGYLFSYLEYTGDDFDADNEKMSADPTMKEWDRLCSLCHESLGKPGDSDLWVGMEELFHLD